MYAIIETGGKQYRVQPGDVIEVERLSGERGASLELGRVLMVGGADADVRVGQPTLDGATVRAEVLDHPRGDKIIIYRFKSKVRYRRKTGHRQDLTRLRITDILLDGARQEAAASGGRRRAAAAETATEEPAAAPA